MMDMEMGKGVPGGSRKDQHHIRSQSFAYHSKSSPSDPKSDPRLKKVSANYGDPKSVSSRFASWNCMNDPEFQRKKRVANYKAYAMEGKMKGSLRKSFKWVKDRCNQVINGY